MASTCDNASVGILVIHVPTETLLLIKRGTEPAGWAPPAGHVFDDHTVTGADGSVQTMASYLAAGAAECAEEVGIQTSPEQLRYVHDGWRANACRRQVGPMGVGHHWVTLSLSLSQQRRPDLTLSGREVAGALWATRAEVEALASRTLEHVAGRVSPARFAAAPGLEPVHLLTLVRGGWLELPSAALGAVEESLS